MFLSLLTAVGLSLSTAQAASIPKADYQLQLDEYSIGTQDYRFPSGLRILFQEEHTQPIVAITNWFDRGSVYDGVGVNGKSVEGMAHAVEHLAFRAKHGDLPKNWDVINQLGGVLNASTSREWTNYMTVAPVDATIPLLRIEALRMADGLAGVTEEDVEEEKAIVRNELRMGYESGANGSAAIRTAFLHIPKLLYPEGHIYRNTTIGSHETIMNIQLADVQRYVRESYRPEFATIAVVGDFKMEGGQGMGMIFRAFSGVEHLLMAPEHADEFKKLTDPAEQQEYINGWLPKLEAHLKLMFGEPPKARVDCSTKVEPPDRQSGEVVTIKGMVDKPTVIAAWSLPSGYCPEDIHMNIAANMLTNYIQRTVDREYDPLTQEGEVDGIGCFVDTDRRGSVLLCMAEKGKLGKLTPERMLDRVADALYMQTQPMDAVFKPFVDRSITQSRQSNMAQILGMTDEVASLYGRAFFVSQHAHYRGNAQFFSDSITDSNLIDLEPARVIAGKYITRDRMVRLIIEPMDEEDRERLEASASEADKTSDLSGQHRAKDDRSRQLFNTEDLTAEAIKDVTVVPDLTKARVVTLDNGLEIVLMNHGEAPLVRVGLRVKGDNAVSPKFGLDTLADNVYDYNIATNRNPKENPLGIAGSAFWTSDNQFTASGSSGNLEALLHKTRWHVEEWSFLMANKAGDIKSWKRSNISDGKEPETWADRLRGERLFPDHPQGRSFKPADYDAMKGYSGTEIKDWLYTKWQPANAQLVVVGKIPDMDAAEKSVRTYFDSWEFAGSGAPGPVAPPPKVTKKPDRQVLLFDKPIATQSKVRLSCQMDYNGREDLPAIQVIGEYLTFLAFERLREEKGLTYGAYAAPRTYWGDNSELILATVIQNSGIGTGIQTFFDLVEEASSGEVAKDDVKTNAWNVGRTSVTRLQSGNQMLSALLSPGPGKLDEYNRYGDDLGKVSPASLATVLKPCKGHEIVTVVGPVEPAKKQLDELGIKYEVVDWEVLYEGQLTPKGLKAYKKAKAKAAEEAAEKAAAEDKK
jgi:zinc protease